MRNEPVLFLVVYNITVNPSEMSPKYLQSFFLALALLPNYQREKAFSSFQQHSRKTVKSHLEKAAGHLMVCFIKAKAEEYLRAPLKCIQIETYRLSVNSMRISTGVCARVCVCVSVVISLKVRP